MKNLFSLPYKLATNKLSESLLKTFSSTGFSYRILNSERVFTQRIIPMSSLKIFQDKLCPHVPASLIVIETFGKRSIYDAVFVEVPCKFINFSSKLWSINGYTLSGYLETQFDNILLIRTDFFYEQFFSLQTPISHTSSFRIV